MCVFIQIPRHRPVFTWIHNLCKCGALVVTGSYVWSVAPFETNGQVKLVINISKNSISISFLFTIWVKLMQRKLSEGVRWQQEWCLQGCKHIPTINFSHYYNNKVIIIIGLRSSMMHTLPSILCCMKRNITIPTSFIIVQTIIPAISRLTSEDQITFPSC